MSYSYSSELSVNAAAVGANETNFPVALVVTDARFGQDGQCVGGHVKNVDASGGASGSLEVPADFVVSTDSAGTSVLDFEIVAYDKTTGALELWVEIDSLSAATGATLYLCYGDSGVTTSQENVAGTWGNGFEGVWHLGEASGTIYDSTGNGNDSDASAGITYGQTGQVGDCLDFDGSSAYVNINNANLTDGLANFTVETWVDLDATNYEKRGWP